MSVSMEKIPGGFRVDGIELRSGKCGCTSIARCCYSLSRVRKKADGLIEVSAKMTDPETRDIFTWGYVVAKEGMAVKVSVEDARDKEIFSGYIPPAVHEWEARGWEVLEKHGQREDGVVWRCAMCKWLYREEGEGIPFHRLPGEWKCPKCGAGRDSFEKIG